MSSPAGGPGTPALPALPPRREDRPGADAYAIAVVCLGNICRSPTAHVVLEACLEDAAVGDRVRVSSAGTGGWHVGAPMDRRAAAALSGSGYDPSGPRAEQFEEDWFARHDLVLAMDTDNLADLRELAAAAERRGTDVGEDRLRLFRDFDPEIADAAASSGDGGSVSTADPRDRIVPDPYYGGEDGFAEVLAMVERTSGALAHAVADLLTE